MKIITNNPKVITNYENLFHSLNKDDSEIILEKNYEDVLIKTKYLIQNGYELITHPISSSLKPNQTPYKSLIVRDKLSLYDKISRDKNIQDSILIENAIENFKKWEGISSCPKDYSENIKEDFMTIDLSTIEHIIFKLIT